MRLGVAVWVLGLVACGGAAAPPPQDPAPPPGKVVDMGEFSVELPAGQWRPSGDVSGVTMEIPRAAGVDESGGGFALYDPKSDVFVHGFDGKSAPGAPDPAALVDAVHGGADVAFAGSWRVTHRDRRDAGRERRQNIAADDAQGLSMQALIITVVDDAGAVHGAGVQCVFKKADAAARAPLCRRVLESLRLRPASSAAPAARTG